MGEMEAAGECGLRPPRWNRAPSRLDADQALAPKPSVSEVLRRLKASGSPLPGWRLTPPEEVVAMSWLPELNTLETLILRLAVFVIFTATVAKFVMDHWPWRRRQGRRSEPPRTK